MKRTRPVLAAALAVTLALSACSGDDDQNGVAGTDTSTSDPVGATDGTGDVADRTADAAAETVTPSTSQGSVTLEEADEIASELLTNAARAAQETGRRARLLREEALAGPEYEAQRAAGLLEAVEGEPPEVDLDENPIEPTVLAISREGEGDPAYILAQSVPEDTELPSLHLMLREDAEEEFRVVWSAEMLPGTSLQAFDRRSAGSPVVGDGDLDLVAAPADILQDLAAMLGYPLTEPAREFETNGYVPEVRQAAREQAGDVGGQADFTQTDTLLEDDVHTLALADGSAMVFGVFERKAEFEVQPGSTVVPPDDVAYFAEDDAFTRSGTVSALVFVAVHVRTNAERRPELVAVHEQIVDAQGS